MKNRIVYALVDITDGQIFKNKFYIKRPSKSWVRNDPDWKIVTFELKKLNEE